MKRRTGAANFCSTKRGSDRESITRKPTGSTVQPMMSSVRGQVCSAAAPTRNLDLSVPARSTAAAAPSPNNADEITSALVPRSVRDVSVHNSTTTTRMTSPGSARASRLPNVRPDTPPAQPRPNIGTRMTEGRNPISGPTRASMLGVAIPGGGYGHDDIDIARRHARLGERRARRPYEQVACAFEVGLGALAQVMRRAQPLQRTGRIPALDARIDEHISQFRIARECARVDLFRGISDRR